MKSLQAILYMRLGGGLRGAAPLQRMTHKVLLIPIIVSVLATTAGRASQMDSSEARMCNGLPFICEKHFDEVVFPGNHNAGSGANGLLHTCRSGDPASTCFYRNQGRTITQQLAFGIRYFDIDTRICWGDLVTHHNGPIGPSVERMIDEFDAFLKSEGNRNEVIVITFGDQMPSGDDYLQALIYNDLARWAPTAERLQNGQLTIFKKTPGAPWPTLGYLVNSNQRIIIVVKDPSHELEEMGSLSEEDDLHDTYQSRSCTSSCSGVVEDTYSQCLGAPENELVLVTVNCSSGRCLPDLAHLCQAHLLESLESCTAARQDVPPSFIIADWTQNSSSTPNIVNVVKYFNQEIVKEDDALDIADDTASYIGFESFTRGTTISATGNPLTQRLTDQELWKWETLGEPARRLSYGETICLRSKHNSKYLTNRMDGLATADHCLDDERWRIERYDPANPQPIDSIGRVQAGDRVCLLSETNYRYLSGTVSYLPFVDFVGHCGTGFIIHADWNDCDRDRVIDSGDNCPLTYNPEQADTDGDAVGDLCDNCPDTANSDQGDLDEDGIGNICDEDLFFTTRWSCNLPLESGPVRLCEHNMYGIHLGGNEIEPWVAGAVPARLGLDAVDVLSDGGVLFSVRWSGFVRHSGGRLFLKQSAVYSHDVDTQLLAPVLDWRSFGMRVWSLNAVDRLRDGSYAFSVGLNQFVRHSSGTAYLRPSGVYVFDPESRTIELLFDAGVFGVHDVDGLDVLPDGRIAFSKKGRGFGRMYGGMGPLRSQNVYIYDPENRTLELGFDGRSLGVSNIDGFTLAIGVE